MRELKQYVCDTCGTVYKEKELCEMCEKGHTHVDHVISATYQSTHQNGKYPQKVYIEFEDGSRRYYKLTSN